MVRTGLKKNTIMASVLRTVMYLLCLFIVSISLFLTYSIYQKKERLHGFNIPQDSIAITNGQMENEVDVLTQILEDKIRRINTSTTNEKMGPVCDSKITIANSCDNNKCLRMGISEIPRERLIQIVRPKRLQLTPDNELALNEMKKQVQGFHDVIILTAASSNHFRESQALIKNLHKNIFPVLKNFKLVYYNLGLTKKERQQLKKYCKCTVVDFPFERFPDFMHNLSCYSWKPAIIRAHIGQAKVIVWADASVRFQDTAMFLKRIETTRERGFQMAGPSERSPLRTARSMYHFFGDEPCAYLNMGQFHATNGFFHNEPFVIRAILEPWVACAMNQSCILCPTDFKQRPNNDNNIMIRKWKAHGAPVIYGLMHRFDQSAISLIVHKLYQKHFQWLLFDLDTSGMSFNRGQTANYFPSLT